MAFHFDRTAIEMDNRRNIELELERRIELAIVGMLESPKHTL